MSQEKFCLKWNNFQSTVSGSFGTLRKEEDFLDVTLVSDDESQLLAHKLVLSASSSFFKTILKSNKHSHPLIYLSGVNAENLGFILDYVYHGQVQIHHEKLNNFLEVAEKLKIEGLISDENGGRVSIKDQKDKSPGLISEEKVEVVFRDQDDFDDILLPYDVSSEEHVNNTKKEMITKFDFSTATNIEEIDQKIEELTDRVNGVWTCKACGKTSKRRRDLGWHIETHLDGLSFPCNDCDKTFRSRSALDNHRRKFCKKSLF